jgi:hypothetical protein
MPLSKVEMLTDILINRTYLESIAIAIACRLCLGLRPLPLPSPSFAMANAPFPPSSLPQFFRLLRVDCCFDTSASSPLRLRRCRRAIVNLLVYCSVVFIVFVIFVGHCH